MSLEKRREWFDQPYVELNKSDISRLADLVPGHLPRGPLEYFIQAAARTFGWARQCAEPPRPLVRYQLRLLAHLVWKARNRPFDREIASKELFHVLGNMDPVTKEKLLEGIALARPDGWAPEFYVYSPHGAHFGAIFEGALIAERRLVGRGDYTDVALHQTAAFLIWIYDMWTDTIPSVGRQEIGPETARGTRRTVAASRFADFAYVFFRKVDPELTQSRITSALRERVAKIREQRAAGMQDYHDLANLLH